MAATAAARQRTPVPDVSPGTTQAGDAGTLPRSQWRKFAAHYWERSVVTMPSINSEPLVDEQTMFLTLVRAAGLYLLGARYVRFSFWIDCVETKDFADLLPKEEDETLLGYDQRLKEQLQNREYTVLLADLHLYDEAIWNRVRVFLRGLYRQVGTPCGGVDTGVFFGRYSHTPFGVHRGQMSVITSPTIGVKHFRLWPRGYGDAHEDIRDSLSYPNHVSAGLELSAAATDILYWPSDFWHIAEGTGTFTAALNIGFWWERPPLSRVLMEMSQQLADEISPPTDQRVSLVYTEKAPRTLADALPTETRAALEATRRVIASSRMEEALILESLRMRSADEFRDIPPPADFSPARWEAGTVVKRVPECFVLFVTGSDDEIYVAANGHLLKTQNHERVNRFLKEIESDESITLDSWLLKIPAAVELLSWLMNVRALRME
jgi:hypothetical protein